MKNILLIGDFVGYGKIALSAQIPMLSSMNVRVSNLPTALVSNSFEYKKFAVADLTSYMQETVDVWAQLDLQFDIIITGFFNHQKQVDCLHKIISFQKNKPIIICDPILGDNGSLYNGMNKSMIDIMKSMIAHADIIVPNMTEMSLLLDEKYPEEISETLMNKWIDVLRKKGAKSIVVTGVTLENQHFVYGFDNNVNEIFKVSFEMIPHKFSGSGDIFTALLGGFLAEKNSLKKTIEKTVKIISDMLRSEIISDKIKMNNIDVERYIYQTHNRQLL